jgi:hypothetical protein
LKPVAVAVLGIDEACRGARPNGRTTRCSVGRVWVVDRWDTGLVDITGDRGLLAQVNGRTSRGR